MREREREIGRVYAARGPWSDDIVPGDPADEAMFESRPIPDAAWLAFEDCDLCARMHGLEHAGIIGRFEEFSFGAAQLPALIALLEAGIESAPPPARSWLCELLPFARRAQERGVGLSFVLSG